MCKNTKLPYRNNHSSAFFVKIRSFAKKILSMVVAIDFSYYFCVFQR